MFRRSKKIPRFVARALLFGWIEDGLGREKKLSKQILDNQELLKSEGESEFSAILKEDIVQLEKRIQELQLVIENLLVPLIHMIIERQFLNYGQVQEETKRLYLSAIASVCISFMQIRRDGAMSYLSCTPSEIGGFKEYVMVLSGPNVYRFMQYEGGNPSCAASS